MKITLIGCGNMGSAIARRLSQDHSLTLFNIHEEKAIKLAKELQCKSVKTIEEALAGAEIIILAVKPAQMNEVAAVADHLIQSHQLLVSILGGLTHQALREAFSQPQLLLMMPNIPCQYGAGVIGLALTPEITEEIKKRVEEIFSSLGQLYWIAEKNMNALAALAGSGPAFIFVMIESMIDAGISMGFSVKQAKEIVLQTMLGSVTLMKKTGGPPSELKWQVTSPAGTTIAGIETLENHGVRAGIINTFLATYRK